MHDLDGVFDADDMFGTLLVDHVHEGRQRRRLARRCRSRDKHDALLEGRQAGERRRQVQRLQRRRSISNYAQHAVDAPELAIHIEAEATDAGQRKRAVDMTIALESRDVDIIQQRTQGELGQGGRQRLLGDGPQAAEAAHAHRLTGVDMDVGRPLQGCALQ